MLKPNEGRILVKLAQQKEAKNGEIILPHGQATVGDSTVRVCEVVQGGDSPFKKGQLVYVQEYSMMAVADYKRYLEGKISPGDLFKAENVTYSVSKYDIVAFNE
jgi:co-chaperonin GroES (HSP10)